MARPVEVELLLVPQCPHADAARTLLARCQNELGLHLTVVERVGDFPSPTILVDGRDVMTGREVAAGVSACRLDVPTASQVLQALQHATRPAPTGPSSRAEDFPAELAIGVTPRPDHGSVTRRALAAQGDPAQLRHDRRRT